MPNLSSTDRFAAIAREFCAWAEGAPAGTEHEEVAAVLRLLVDLYAAALALPEGEAAEDEAESTAHDEWLRVYQRCASLPVDMYRLVANPLDTADVEADVEPRMATIGDDLADIHRDLRRGFHWYDRGRPENAAWEWSFHFRVHWGQHATAALSALHAWWVDAPTPPSTNAAASPPAPPPGTA